MSRPDRSVLPDRRSGWACWRPPAYRRRTRRFARSKYSQSRLRAAARRLFFSFRMELSAAHAQVPLGYRPRDPTGTVLYGLVAEHHATFRQVASEVGGVAHFVDDAFERFLRCGIAALGFARFSCGDCGHDHLVALSCKGRGLCPSCGGRRMAALTQQVMEATLPHVPVRQWVLSLPYPLRYRLAYDQSLCTAVHRALTAALRARMRDLARGRGEPDAQTGSVTFVQRYGGGLNLNLHFHLLGLDGWFYRCDDGELRFEVAPAPTQADVEALVLDVQARVMRLLERQGLLESTRTTRSPTTPRRCRPATRARSPSVSRWGLLGAGPS